MTKISITHNPFDVKTEIIIDHEPISETSGLYKYLNTPMQDWVSDFLPTLVEHCNDDELEITFTGLACNFDDLKSELEAFLEKNCDYDIELKCDDFSKSPRVRLGTIESVVDEMQTQTIVPELQTQEFVDAVSVSKREPLRIIVMGGLDRNRSTLVDKLLDCPVDRYDPSVGFCCIDNDSGEDIAQEGTAGSFHRYSRNIPFIKNRFCYTELYELPDLETCANSYTKDFRLISSITFRFGMVDSPIRQSSMYSFISAMLIPQFLRQFKLLIQAMSLSSKRRRLFLSRFTLGTSP